MWSSKGAISRNHQAPCHVRLKCNPFQFQSQAVSNVEAPNKAGETFSHWSTLAFHFNDATQGLFQQEATLLIFFSCCSFVGLFLLNLLIRRDARLTSLGTSVSCWFLCKWRQQAGALCLLDFVVILGFQRQKLNTFLEPRLISSAHHRPQKTQPSS